MLCESVHVMCMLTYGGKTKVGFEPSEPIFPSLIIIIIMICIVKTWVFLTLSSWIISYETDAV